MRMMELANYIARRFPKIKQTLAPIYYPIKKLGLKKRQKLFKKYSLDILKDFHNCMESNGYHYTLAFGTMLGAVREKGFIKHDIDIDVCLWIDEWDINIEKVLKEAEFKLDHYFLIDGGERGREETYIKHGVSIDVFYIFPAIDALPYCCDFLGYEDAPTFSQCNKKHGGAQARRLEMPFVRERCLTQFEDTMLYIPLNAHKLLEYRYGETYLTPNPSWTIQSFNKHIVNWSEKKGIYVKK